ncbi:MAG: hypothetical protein ACE5K4_05750 [Candidatus Hydrothermarchaeota archaeon]
MIWLLVALTLSITDLLHEHIFWKKFEPYYFVFGSLLRIKLNPIGLWFVHELIESIFHLFLISIIFFSFTIGFIAAMIHLALDIYHTLFIHEISSKTHRLLHFSLESIILYVLL